ncbi:hypothetical protein K505DRAFT_112235 [Melanomma pulvis-pyrius CBS 109.77]|uniref:Uncharacterized protein n=1 Tax=Melanomma pulvis-pyrius CBS 109.77 TaxID=1314802 RepID=A0A6A6WWH8_9PLEO|nr:hypothetical protein K505DRAFT_112235 [Melanomma pulvis-pyrius CBS 109.77]
MGSDCAARSAERRAFHWVRWPGIITVFSGRGRALGWWEGLRSAVGRSGDEMMRPAGVAGKGCETAKVTGCAKSVHAASARRAECGEWAPCWAWERWRRRRACLRSAAHGGGGRLQPAVRCGAHGCESGRPCARLRVCSPGRGQWSGQPSRSPHRAVASAPPHHHRACLISSHLQRCQTRAIQQSNGRPMCPPMPASRRQSLPIIGAAE